MSQQTFNVPVVYKIVGLNSAIIEHVLGILHYQSDKVPTQPRLSHIYSLAKNTETGLFRVEGKEAVTDSRINIVTLETHLHLPMAVLGADITFPRQVPLFSIKDCVAKVFRWATDRGILGNGIWYTQATKLYEEDGEAATGIGKNKHPLVMDGIGDALVVLVNLMELSGYEALEIACHVAGVRAEDAPLGNAHYLFHKMRYHLTLAVDYLWDEAGIDSDKKLDFKSFDNGVCDTIEYHYSQMLQYANALANAYNTTLEECFSLAWDEIKDRKGFLNADGIFIKESDAGGAKEIVSAEATTVSLYDLDPNDPNLTTGQKTAILEEAKVNFSYFVNRCIGIPIANFSNWINERIIGHADKLKGVPVHYLPVTLSGELTNRVLTMHGFDDVIILSAGVQYSGETNYAAGHLRVDYAIADVYRFAIFNDGAALMNTAAGFELIDDAALYTRFESPELTQDSEPATEDDANLSV